MGKEAARPTLIYLHLPKCAGTSLMPVLKANYGAGFHRVGNGGGWRKFHKRPAGQRAQITCLTGHMPWGLHRHVPGPHCYAVMLRHPVDRLASLYWFARRFSKHRHHRAAQKLSLIDFATCGAMADLDNGMVRFLAGRGACGSLKARRAVNDTDLVAAMTHLTGCAVVGFVETFKQSLRQMAQVFEWEYTGYESKMIGKHYPKPTGWQRQTIAERNRFDMALYEYALGLDRG